MALVFPNWNAPIGADLNQAYLAYFGRPMDPTGVAYFSDKTWGEVCDAFSASAESIALLNATGNEAAQINAIYLNLFNRDAEVEGLSFWLEELALGHFTLAQIAMVISENAAGNDKLTLDAKLAASDRFYAALDTAEEFTGYSGDENAADARAFLDPIGAGDVPSQADLDAAVYKATHDNIVTPPSPTLEIAPSAVTVAEGGTVVFTVTTTNVAAGTVYAYSLTGTGIAAGDIVGGTSGTVTIDSLGKGYVTVTVAADATTEGVETMKMVIGSQESVGVAISDTSTTPVPPAPVNQTLVLTPGVDILSGGGGDDTFVATQNTLQIGDNLSGNAGDDTLQINISGNSSDSYYDGFETNSVETVSVKSLSFYDVTLDMSDVNYNTEDGTVTILSRETDSSPDEQSGLYFWDIQKINETKLVIQDTDVDHYFVYDAGSSATADNLDGRYQDTVSLTVSEMRGRSSNSERNNWYSDIDTPNQSSITDEDRGTIEHAPLVRLANTTNSDQMIRSYVDNVELESAVGDGVSPTVKNTMALEVGEDLDTLTITGSADLEIVNVLDENIRLIDARNHADGSSDSRADLILNLSNSSDGDWYKDQNAFWTDDVNLDGYVSADNEEYSRQGKVDTVVLFGSQGDDLITFGTTHNDKSINLGTGNDTLIAGWGDASIDAGAGHDVMTVGMHNDSVNAGTGDDRIVDLGSTERYKMGPDGARYNPEYPIANTGNWYDLGDGHDTLEVMANPAYTNYDVRGGVAGSNDTVTAGTGNDMVMIHGSALDGNATQPGFQRVDTIVDLGTGDDYLTVGDAYFNEDADAYEWDGDRGNVSVNGGDGNDFIGIARDGDQTVVAGKGDDWVEILQDNNEFTSGHYDGTARDGNHKVWLGEGDDYLFISGRSEVAVSGKTTDIDAGSGDDFVEIEQDHRLNVKLGTGDDTLQMRAQDLQSNDTIQGGDNYMTDTVNGYDTIVLTNESDTEFYGEVRDSETRHVFAIEQFNLLDSNIRLHITDNLVETALNQTVIVDTTGSERGDFPIDLRDNGILPETQGMLWSDWMYYYGPDEIPGLDHIRTPDPAHPNDRSYDQMFATYENPVPHQTVDLTALNTVDYTFELRGGSLQDIVVVDEDALSADLYLDFDSTGDNGEGWAYTDTLQVVDGAALRAADMENVNDLEIIDLVASSNIAQTWTIELNNHVINQPTALEPLIVRIDPNVPAGSKVYVVFSENNTSGAENDVIIERNSNVQVYIVTDEGAMDWEAFLAHEDQYNTDVPEWHFNGSPFKVVVKTSQFFTDNADNLQGTSADDLFIAQTLDQVQAGDQADGHGGDYDTVELRFAVANQVEALAEQLEYVGLPNIEVLHFNTENQVMFRSLDYGWFGWGEDLETIVSGNSSDRMEQVERGDMFFRMENGNDYISFDGYYYTGNYGYTMYETIDGGNGNDTVQGSYTNDNYLLGGVENVYGGSGNDTFTYSQMYDMVGNDGDIYVNGNSGEDALYLDSDGTNGTATVDNVERIEGDDGVDIIDATMYDGNAMSVWGGAGADSISAVSTSSSTVYVNGGTGDDDIFANNSSGLVVVDGGTGNDHIVVGTASPSFASVVGGSGNDYIEVHAHLQATVDGGTGADDIHVTVGGAFANSTDADASVVGGDGNDTIYVMVNDDATVRGGNDNDLITVNSDNDMANGSGTPGSYIFGDNGNDTINTQGDADYWINAGGDTGNDLINLQALGSGVDTIVFGDIAYSALQVQNLNTQGVDTINDFNFEDGPGPDPLDPGQDDVLDFGAFLTGSKATDDFYLLGGLGTSYAVAYDDWTGGVNSLDMDDQYTLQQLASKIAVITVANSFTAQDLRNSISLDAPGTSGDLELNDGSRTVVMLAKDSDPTDALVGYDKFEVYYVQDVDTSSGSAVWAVDLVATINATTAVGSVQGSIGVNQFVW